MTWSDSPVAFMSTLLLMGAMDVLFLRRAGRNLVAIYSQAAFSITTLGAACVTRPEHVPTLLVLAALTKTLVHVVFGRIASGSSSEASATALELRRSRAVFLAASMLVVPAYAWLVDRGGLSWFIAGDLRVAYTAENGVVLRVVRHWSPVLTVWGVATLVASRAGESAARRATAVTATALCVGIHFVAYSFLEGSKSASVRLLVMLAGAVQLMGVRLRKKYALPVGVASILLLGYFVSLSAGEASLSLSDGIAARAASGSQGFVDAVEHAGASRCGWDTLVSPVTTFIAKITLQPVLRTFTSMGHCLASPDPDYPWELLVPLLAEAYHVGLWAVPAFFAGYVAFALGLVAVLRRMCRAVGLPELAFPVSYFMAYYAAIIPIRGKLSNFVISELVSVIGLIALLSVLKPLTPRVRVAQGAHQGRVREVAVVRDARPERQTR